MRFLNTVLLAGSLLLSSMVWAEGGGDRVFEKMLQRLNTADAVLIQAEKAPLKERHVHMATHMKMLEGIMTELHSTHPTPGMSTEQHLAWMEAHDKVVDGALTQMIREHKLMMSVKECNQ